MNRKTDSENFLQAALGFARETRYVEIGTGVIGGVGRAFERFFGSASAVIVADENTFAAAGRDVMDALRHSGQRQLDPFIFHADGLHAEWKYIEELEAALSATDGIAVAVGSGTINDLTKLVSSRIGRPYMAVATAASMDGYTAYGASITKDGSKQTFDCPAPVAVIADLNVVARAPEGMNASGYADLLAKLTAGADWLLADGAGIEAVDPTAWRLVQADLKFWLSEPRGVREGNPDHVERLLLGLMAGGFAMQHHRTSRPASGAEHQFSHLWDMEHHTYRGEAPSHGFKVGIGTLASARLHEFLLRAKVLDFDAEALAAEWPDADTAADRAASLFGAPELQRIARQEITAKHPSRAALRIEIETLKHAWSTLCTRLRQQLPPAGELTQWLAEVGAPTDPGGIGISVERLRRSHWQAQTIRRRYTILDVFVRYGMLESALRELYPAESQGYGNEANALV